MLLGPVEREAERGRLIVRADPIDVDERLVGQAQTPGPANARRAAAPDAATCAHDAYAGDAGGDHVLELGRMPAELERLGHVDITDGVAQRAGLRAARGTGHDNRVELNGQFRQRDAHGVITDARIDGRYLIADTGDAQAGRGARNIVQQELAACAGARDRRGPLDGNGCVGNRESASAVDDRAADRLRLGARGRGPRHNRQKEETDSAGAWRRTDLRHTTSKC